ncbi:hypothetical protein DsansV1_C07g0076041 [Dioscorea sansibarensis]
MASSEKQTLKLLIDMKRKKMAFAECNKDFADVLLCFLTFPLGTVSQLLFPTSYSKTFQGLKHGTQVEIDSHFWAALIVYMKE